MKRVAIVSSYNEECGAAFYSSRLKKHLDLAGYHVDVIRLPVSLLRVTNPKFVRLKGDREIARICNEIRDYDCVLLQFEPGLYGTNAKSSYGRVEQLLRASKRAIVTVHGFERGLRKGGFFDLAGDLASGDVGKFIDEIGYKIEKIEINRFWDYVRKASHVQVMTFCRGDAVVLKRFYDVERVSDFPITYFDQEEVASIRKKVDRDAFLSRFGLDPKKKYFSVLGFLSAYKGHLTAMKALEYLPDDWHLAIVGGEHPQGIAENKDIGAYIRQMLAYYLYPEHEKHGNTSIEMKSIGFAQKSFQATQQDRQELKEVILKKSEFKYFVMNKDVSKRIHFLGQVTDEQMPEFYTALDYVTHPYMRTREGQSGSGPATMAIEFGSKSLFTNAPVFREMNQYFDGAMQMFNIGNFVELAEAMQRYDNFEPQLRASRETALKTYNPVGMIEAYRTLMDG